MGFILPAAAQNQLVYRALMISSKCFLGDEIKFIKSTLSKNEYPLSVLDVVVPDVMIKFDRASSALLINALFVCVCRI